jgi:hypothetical protein
VRDERPAGRRRAILGLVALVVSIVAFFAIVEAASAHRYSRATVASAVYHSNYDGYCGKGFFNYCLYNGWPAIGRAVDAHSYTFSGYYQERVAGHIRRRACKVSGTVTHKHTLGIARNCYWL